ncbi:hypothetical protein ABT095_07685 [Kitasatospora sp. NPDC002227]|uniref:hypothetical protein n=1 Tax=Kitasatospora sp. NPDC002227 TaxID=3154773 RepID=UPI0033271018
MTTAVTTLLTPYHQALPNAQRIWLAEQLLDESLARCTCRRGAARHAREAVHSAAFTEPCAPAGASPAELLTAGRYPMLFLLVEDSPAEEARSLAELLREPARPTGPGPGPGPGPGSASGTGTGTGEARSQLDALLADFEQRGLPTGRLLALLAELCSAVAAESATDPAAPPPSPEQLRRRRMGTIGTYPYLECWRLLHGLPPADPGTAAGRLTDAAVEAVYLADDLLRADGGPGLVREAAVTRYNELVHELATAPSGPYPGLLARVVDGRLTVHRDLAAARRPGAPPALTDRLHRVAEAWA